MQGSGVSLFRVLTIAILLGGTALAQKGGDNSTYFVTFFPIRRRVLGFRIKRCASSTTATPEHPVRATRERLLLN